MMRKVKHQNPSSASSLYTDKISETSSQSESINSITPNGYTVNAEMDSHKRTVEVTHRNQSHMDGQGVVENYLSENAQNYEYDDYDYSNNYTNDINYRRDSSLIENDKTNLYKSKHKCDTCNLDKQDESFIILSCCKSICHSSCIFENIKTKISYDSINTSNVTNAIDTSESVLKLNELKLNELKCFKCKTNIQETDILHICSKNIIVNQKYMSRKNQQLTDLIERKRKLENEIKNMNLYISKLDNETKLSKLLVKKICIMFE